LYYIEDEFLMRLLTVQSLIGDFILVFDIFKYIFFGLKVAFTILIIFFYKC